MLFFLLFSLLPLMIASAVVGVCFAFICGLIVFVCANLWHWKGLYSASLMGLIIAPWAGFFVDRPLQVSLFFAIVFVSSAIAIVFRIGKGKWKEQVFDRLDQLGVGLFLADHQVQILQQEAFHAEREENLVDKRLLEMLKSQTQKLEDLERENSLLETIITRLSKNHPSSVIRRKKIKEEKGQTMFPF